MTLSLVNKADKEAYLKKYRLYPLSEGLDWENERKDKGV